MMNKDELLRTIEEKLNDPDVELLSWDWTEKGKVTELRISMFSCQWGKSPYQVVRDFLFRR
jgi:hypothetical protein